jgi:predicted nicotinamide N-methyase
VCPLQSTTKEYFKTYFNQDGTFHLCSLIETRELISQGTTGLKTWPGAGFLLQWLQDHRETVLKNSVNVLELGSGIGFTGLALLKLGLVSQLTFSDHHHAVLKTLRTNLNRNDVQESTGRIELIDWETFTKTDMIEASLNPDLVIGADIVFDQSIIPALVQTLNTCLDKATLAVIACVERNEATKEAFETHLDKIKLKFTLNKFENSMLLYKITKPKQ